MVVEGRVGIRTRRFVKLFVFGRAKPRTMHHLALRFIGRRKVREVSKPTVTNGGFQNLPQSHDLTVDGAACRRFVLRRAIGS